eukprot:4164166-Pleurochrysis_carterae.AAC.2
MISCVITVESTSRQTASHWSSAALASATEWPMSLRKREERKTRGTAGRKGGGGGGGGGGGSDGGGGGGGFALHAHAQPSYVSHAPLGGPEQP